MIDHDQASKHVTNKDKKITTWSTQGGDFKIFTKSSLDELQLPQLNTIRDFSHKLHLFEKKTDKYDAIIGRDLQQALGMDIMNSKGTFDWIGIQVPFKPMGYWDKELISNFWETKSYHAEESFKAVAILDAKYEILDLDFFFLNRNTYLSQKNQPCRKIYLQMKVCSNLDPKSGKVLRWKLN